MGLAVNNCHYESITTKVWMPLHREIQGLCFYSTSQAQHRTYSHVQLCSRFLKSLIKGRGNFCSRDSVAAVSLTRIATETVAMPLN